MHYFLTFTLQYFFLAAYALMMLGQCKTVVQSLRWAYKNGYTVHYLPGLRHVGYALFMTVTSALTVLLYQYWGWELLAKVVYYGLIPTVVFVTFCWMNLKLFSEYRMKQFMDGNYTWFVRLILAITKVSAPRQEASQ